MTISRRLFFRGSAAAAAVPLMAQGSRVLAPPRVGESGLLTGKPKPLPYDELAGFLGAEQIRWHHESHYGGALAGLVALDGDPTGNHRSRVGKMNSVLLHELYFDGMTAESADPGKRTVAALSARFGSVERWRQDFEAAARSARGWAVLAYHPVNRKLYNVVTDSHDDGPPWLGVPLVVADTYEHSYYLDFQTRKGDYVAGFGDHIDWGVVEQRLRACPA